MIKITSAEVGADMVWLWCMDTLTPPHEVIV